MFFFEDINLDNFRNFNKFNLTFNNKCNVLLGPNGSGKTNLLESLSLFEKGRGFKKDKFNNMINNNNLKKMFVINSNFLASQSKLKLSLSSEIKNDKLKKKLLINGSNSSDSLKYFENLFTFIFFLPEMESLFLTSPSVRRNFIDRLVYGIDKDYIKIINNYKKKIIERSNVLKELKYDKDWISQLENEIVNYGVDIYTKRIKHLKVLNEEIKSLKEINKNFYNFELILIDAFINEDNIQNNEFKSKYLLKLESSREYDSITGGCQIGPHKSDISGNYFTNNLKLSFCSTGQQKAFVLLTIIAQSKILIKSLNRQPIILFDEVCSHLDQINREILLELINSLDVQIFLTGTEKNFFSFLSTKTTYCYINNK